MAISVNDLERSIRFYSLCFGMEHYFTQPSPAPHLQAIAYLRSPQGVLELMHIPEHHMSGGFHFCFLSDDLMADYQRLIDEGIPVKSIPRPTAAREAGEEGWLRCVFSGPDGEEVELRGPGSV
ncbi:MAG: VOC family protein [Chloroflexi bacterium]|nr:VOC family protein [Chloroflexota bacterium]